MGSSIVDQLAQVVSSGRALVTGPVNLPVLPHGFKVLQNMLAGSGMFKYVLIVGFLLSGLVGCSEQASDDDFKITLRMSHVFSPQRRPGDISGNCCQQHFRQIKRCS